jgi:asparagine synthase (glutamine-hydrolysing)
MSGLFGIVEPAGAPVDPELLERMLRFQSFRGPDGRGLWAEGGVGLGHTLCRNTCAAPGERQPCTLDGRVWVTADARIDGQDDLVRRLRARGREVPAAVTDPELILHAYAAWGDGCLEHLLGDFAFAIWDGPRRRMLCAVDRLRLKPLYYARAGDALVFANTLGCVRLHPGVSARLRDTAVADFLVFGLKQDLSHTFFADIECLPPAHGLVWEAGRLRRFRYWSIPDYEELRFNSPQDCVEQFQELLGRAVRDRLRGERFGVLVSGGLDSPLVTMTAHRLLTAAGRADDLRAFTYVFDRLIPDRERYYAGLVGQALGLNITFEPLDDFDFFDPTGGSSWPWPEPISDPLGPCGQSQYRQVASVCPVVLTGLGGDVLLRADVRLHWLGLLRTRRLRRLAGDVRWYVRSQRRPPPVGFKAMLRRWRARRSRSQALPAWLNPDFARRTGVLDRWRENRRRPAGGGARDQARQVYHSPAWVSHVELSDANWTGVNLEVRHPLMDSRLAEFFLNLPAVPWCVEKELVRISLRPTVPREVTTRPKCALTADPAFVHYQSRRMGEKKLDLHPHLEYYLDRGMLVKALGNPSEEEFEVHLRALRLDSWFKEQGW